MSPVPDPTNPADLPSSWRSVPSHAKPPAYVRAVARKVKNNRHAKVLAMATKLEDGMREIGLLSFDDRPLLELGDTWWKSLAASAGHDAARPPSAVTRQAVLDKVRADMAEPYRAKGRG
jgi:hypothetical protein